MHKVIKAFCKKVLVGTLSVSMALTGFGFSSLKAEAAGSYNYGDALAKSLLFYQLQESGKLSDETLSRTNWRADSGLKDGQDNGLDLTGGWYDAGDNVKFNLPMAYSSMVLGWSYLNNPQAYAKSGQAKWMLHDIKWANDYFVKCNPDSKTYYYQVGDGGKDHGFWGAPELVEYKMDRPSFKVDDTSANGGSCVTGEAAASLAVASLVLKDSDPSRSATYLAHAKTLYGMAERAKSDEGYTAASGFYTSYSGFYDELALAGCWLYKATGDETYLAKAEKYAENFGTEFQGGTEMAYSWTMSWDDTHMGACLLLAELTGKQKYYTPIENSIDCWNGKLAGANAVTITPGGLSFLSEWGSVRYAANQAFIDTIYLGLPKADAAHKADANAYIERTINYILGSNGQNFMVGYNSQSPKNPHHRAAHGCWSNNLNAEPATSRHTLVGAIVGGPGSANDSYKDVRSDYQANEVACDYNAGFTGACAYLYEKNGYGAVTTPTAIENTDGAEYVLKAGINAQDANNKINFVEIKAVIENHTAWPARMSDNLTLRLFFDISDVLAQGYSASDMKVSTTYMQHPVKISEFKQSDKAGIYYVDVDLTGAEIYPGGQSECKCELQLRFTAPGKWDFSNSPCVKGLGGTSNNQMTTPDGMQLFEGSTLVLGEGFVAPDPVPVPVPDPDPNPVPDPDPDPNPVPDPDPDPVPVPDPDPVPVPNAELNATYTLNNWGSGYQVLIKVKNDSDKRAETWSLKVNKNDVGIDSSWNVNIKEDGNYYVITPMEWNKVIEAGNAVEFGIQGSSHIGTKVEILVDGQSQQSQEQGHGQQQEEQQQGQEQGQGQQEEHDDAIVGDDWLHTDGHKILDQQGHEVFLTGANWFGFNCSERVFHGLWNANMKNVVVGMADHGINLVRVPISTELLLEWKAGKKIKVNINTNSNPELKRADGSDMDSREIFDTFLAMCKENGIKVMMDLHSADANNSGHNYNVWYGPKGFTTEDWITGWTWFVNEYKNDDTIIACDLKNEPHGKYSQADSNAAKWDVSTDENNWRYAASRCGKAILDVNPHLLIMVEGIEETPRAGYDYNSGTQNPNATEAELKYYGGWWGGNLRNAGQYPVDLGKYQSQLVYSPHDYGPLVYKQAWFDKDFTEQTLLDDVWYDSWFYLQDQDIAPLLIGEWGGFMDGGDNEKYLNLMSAFIAKNHINHTFWCINPNSGDTGGLLKDDWATWDDAKYNMMKKTLWSDSKTGKFVGLDHEIPLGKNGETVTACYR